MTAADSTLRSERLPSLDGIRAISIAMVLLDHTRFMFPGWLRPDAKWWDIIASGSRGVSIFFVVSGFIITTLLVEELKKRGTISLRGFYLRRCFRILPPFYIFLACLGVMWGVGWIDLGWKSVATSAAFLRDYVNPGDWWTGHLWSLSVEEQFYLLWPVALMLSGLRSIKDWAVRLIILSPVLRILTFLHWPFAATPIGLMFHTRVDGLMCGCVLALMRTEPGFSAKSRRFLNWQLATPAAVLLLLVSPALFWRYGEHYWLTVGSSLENICISYLLLYAVEMPTTLLARVLNLRLVAHLGRISYSLYLWQQVFLTVLNQSATGRFPVNVIASLGAAELSWWLVEKPALNLRRLLEERQRAQRAVRRVPGASSAE